MSQLPPLNALRAFDVAGRHLNFRAAADRLGVTQGAVAQHVRALEAHLGIQLFERLPKGLAFTEAGRSYHSHISAIFDDLRVATETLLPQAGKVVVSVTPTFAAKWLIPNMPVFARDHPDIDLHVLATERISSFHTDGIDLAVRQGVPPNSASLDVVRLFPQHVLAVCAPHLLQQNDLANMPKLHDAHNLWPDFMRFLDISNWSGQGMRLSQTTLAIDAALSGQGVALVSRFLVARELASGALVQAVPDVMSRAGEFYLIALRHPKRSKAVETAFRWFVAQAEAV